MKQSGARLYEVGTTNRVHPSDYQTAITETSPALILHAHRSNFRITGFTSEPTLSELAEIAHQAGIPLVDDLGSGALLDTAGFGLSHEPMVTESLAPVLIWYAFPVTSSWEVHRRASSSANQT